ncbi:TetR/AcrR family transcriptional regulator [Cellulomonas sp. NPDC057328]|uniref:TetR/AcrR family transcriptional regulator n=1 Tax=Cellulomonas sp. NPDC057328 TaxID=3346101 RepID=UPI00363D990B
MPRATKEQSEATATAVRAAARRLFTERGYAAVPLDEVATEAGVTRGAVYHHYGSRRGLFAAVHAEVQAGVAAAVDEAAQDAADPWESLERGCRAFLEASVADDARRVMLVDGPAVLGWAAWRDVDAASSGRLLDEVLAELARAGRLRDVPVVATSALLSGAMNEAALWIAASADREAATRDAWDALRDLLRGLRADGTARG